MFGLPASTEIKKQLPKAAIYRKFDMDNAARERFDADISRIDIVSEISPDTTSLPAGGDVNSVFVLLVTLKRRDYNESQIILLTRLIDQKLLFVLSYAGQSRLAVYRGKLMQGQWQMTDDIKVPLGGLDLGKVWEGIIRAVEGGPWDDSLSLDENIRRHIEREKILRQIDALEKKMWAERQPSKAFEINRQIIKLKASIK